MDPVSHDGAGIELEMEMGILAGLGIPMTPERVMPWI